MVDEFDEGDKMRRWATNLDDPTPALESIGLQMVAESQDGFDRGIFGKRVWSARAVPNVYGVIADLAKSGGKIPLARRFDARPVLQDTGDLKNLIAHEIRGARVLVGSHLPYAAVHLKGGPIESEEITEDVQKKLWAWLKGKGKEHSKTLGFLLNKKYTGKTLKGNVEARPFVGVTKQTREDIRETVGVEILEIEL